MEVDREHGAALALVGAAPLAVWFLVRQLREENGVDYIIQVPRSSPAAELALGSVSLGVAIAAGVGVWHRRERLVSGGWWRVYGRLLLGGVSLALGARVVTAASVGANIGGGFVLMTGPALVLYLLRGAWLEWRWLRNRDGAGGWTPSAIEWLMLCLAPHRGGGEQTSQRRCPDMSAE
ncbi:MAG: hypothetical protein QNJ81_03290 [Acidimicrobiia bacterium]|nr:hypothetical protein [Acidimicrobiia bacterium]